MIDVSGGGALIEANHRLLPGAWIELQLATPERRVAIRGRVLRCAVARLRSDKVWYRGAVAFDRNLPWMLDREGSGQVVPAGDRAAVGEVREKTTDGAVSSRAAAR